MPYLTEPRRRERRDQIVEATLRCFARQGFANTSMADIIAEAGLSAGSVYSHFTNKAELLRLAVSGVLRSRLSALIEGMRSEQGAIAPGELLARLLAEAHVDTAQAQVLLQVWAEVRRDPELAALVQENLHHLRAMIAKAVAPWVRSRRSRRGKDSTQLADGLLAALLGYVVRVALDPKTPSATVRRGIVSSFKWEPHMKGTS